MEGKSSLVVIHLDNHEHTLACNHAPLIIFLGIDMVNLRSVMLNYTRDASKHPSIFDYTLSI